MWHYLMSYATPVGRNLIGFHVGVKSGVPSAEIKMQEVIINSLNDMIAGYQRKIKVFDLFTGPWGTAQKFETRLY